MVMNHYAELGFKVVETRSDGGSRAILELADFVPLEAPITVTEGAIE